MNRSIEARLKKLESLAAPEMPLRRSYLFAAQTDTERDLAIAALVEAVRGEEGAHLVAYVDARYSARAIADRIVHLMEGDRS
jgi:hypothetical protein